MLSPLLLACVLAGSPYQNYQMRIAYATYKLVLGMPGGERHVGFTRILHRRARVCGWGVGGWGSRRSISSAGQQHAGAPPRPANGCDAPLPSQPMQDGA